jgi:hypothetical protein
MAATPLSFFTARGAARQYPEMVNWLAAALGRLSNRPDVRETRLKRLAQNIDALQEKDETLLLRVREMAEIRRSAAAALHAICSGFVHSLNPMLVRGEMMLDPPEFAAGAFQEDSQNLFQISVGRRVLQVAFETTPELISTEDLRVPYTLQGSVRAFNQELLDRNLIEEQLLFYTLEKEKKMWRFFDARTYRSGPFDQEYLVSLMERLL